jgi:hypothetical protein
MDTSFVYERSNLVQPNFIEGKFTLLQVVETINIFDDLNSEFEKRCSTAAYQHFS